MGIKLNENNRRELEDMCTFSYYIVDAVTKEVTANVTKEVTSEVTAKHIKGMIVSLSKKGLDRQSIIKTATEITGCDEETVNKFYDEYIKKTRSHKKC